MYLEPEYTKSRITDVGFKELVVLPREIDLNEWLASNSVWGTGWGRVAQTLQSWWPALQCTRGPHNTRTPCRSWPDQGLAASAGEYLWNGCVAARLTVLRSWPWPVGGEGGSPLRPLGRPRAQGSQHVCLPHPLWRGLRLDGHWLSAQLGAIQTHAQPT